MVADRDSLINKCETFRVVTPSIWWENQPNRRIKLEISRDYVDYTLPPWERLRFLRIIGDILAIRLKSQVDCMYMYVYMSRLVP